MQQNNPYWPERKIKGTIKHISHGGLPVTVKWDGGSHLSNVYERYDLELVNNIMDVDELFKDIDI